MSIADAYRQAYPNFLVVTIHGNSNGAIDIATRALEENGIHVGNVRCDGWDPNLPLADDTVEHHATLTEAGHHDAAEHLRQLSARHRTTSEDLDAATKAACFGHPACMDRSGSTVVEHIGTLLGLIERHQGDHAATHPWKEAGTVILDMLSGGKLPSGLALANIKAKLLAAQSTDAKVRFAEALALVRKRAGSTKLGKPDDEERAQAMALLAGDPVVAILDKSGAGNDLALDTAASQAVAPMPTI